MLCNSTVYGIAGVVPAARERRCPCGVSCVARPHTNGKRKTFFDKKRFENGPVFSPRALIGALFLEYPMLSSVSLLVIFAP